MDLTLSLTGANGDTIAFDFTNYILTDGVKGFGIPATSLKIVDSATDGGVLRHVKRGVREVDLPILVIGADRADTESKLRRLGKILQNTAGPSRLTATYADGTVFYLDLYYMGGGETTFGQDTRETFARCVVTLQAPNPFWTSLNAQTFTVTTGNLGRGLLPKLSSLKMTSTSALGTVTVNNTLGDVPSFPVWTVYGPLDSLTVNNGSVGFTYSATVTAGSTLTIDTAAGTVVDGLGNNLYANLASAPKLFSVPAGTSTIYVNGSNATTATQISCTYYPRREVLH